MEFYYYSIIEKAKDYILYEFCCLSRTMEYYSCYYKTLSLLLLMKIPLLGCVCIFRINLL